MTIADVMLALVVLAPMALLGVALLWRARLGLDPLEVIVYGVPLGWVISSLALLGITTLVGSIVLPVILAGLICSVCLSVLLWATAPVPGRQRRQPSEGAPGVPHEAPLIVPRRSAILTNRVALTSGQDIGRWVMLAATRTRDHFSPLPVVVFGIIGLIWLDFWVHVIRYEPSLSFAFDSTHFTADWPLHLGDVASMVYGDNFPMQAPRFAGETYSYHYLAAFTAALITKLGVLPGYALAIHSCLGLIFCLLGLYAFARRLFRRTGVAVLGTVLFFLGGSFAWLQTIRTFNASGSLWDTLRHGAWHFGAYDLSRQFTWNQILAHQIMAQRAFLYGIPLFLLIVTLLWLGLQRNDRRLFVAAGLVTGTLPFANASVLLVLPMIIPFLAILFPVRKLTRAPESWLRGYPIVPWLLYAAIAAVLVLPQIVLQQTSGASGIDLRWSPGFDLGTKSATGRDAWWWYAVKNFGFLLLLVPLGLLIQEALSSAARRLLVAFMPLFVLAQLFTFQPLQGDNAKTVIFWYIGGALAAAAGIAAIWRHARTIVPRVFLVVITTMMLLSGILIHVEFLARNAQYGIARADEIAVGERVRDETLPHGVFAAGRWHTNPVLMIGGRSILLGWDIQVSPLGYDPTDREAALREILRHGPDAEALIVRYGIDYVAISSAEVRDYGADPDAYAERYPLAIEEGDFRIFAVSPEAIALAVAHGVELPA
jgi:hypothetical protein